MPEDEFISKPMSPNYAPSQPLPNSTSSTDSCLSLFVTSAEVHSPSKEVSLSQEDDSSSTTDQMPAGSFQQETRELATACWDPQAEEDHPTFPKMEDLPIQQIRVETLKIKRVHWNSKLASTHDIEAVSYTHLTLPTKA